MNLNNYTVNHQDKDILVSVASPGNKKNQCGILLTHGAGGDMYSSQLESITKYLVSEGYTVIRFTCKSLNIVYRKRVFNTILEFVFEKKEDFHITQCFIGGRSMGSRAAVMCCNDITCDQLRQFIKGVICLAYPLHPPHQLNNLRSQPLIDLTKPFILLSGTQDDMATQKLLEDVLQQNKGTFKIYWLAEGDHSHKVQGRSQDEVCMELSNVIHAWATTVKTEHLSSKGAKSRVSAHNTYINSGEMTENECCDEIKTRKRDGKQLNSKTTGTKRKKLEK